MLKMKYQQKNLKKKKNEDEITLEDLGDLHPREIQLIYYIRNRFRFGDLVIQTRDGLPFRIAKSIEYQSLD